MRTSASWQKKHVAARDRERHHDAIATLQILHFAPDFHHLAHELMAEDVAALHRGNETVVEVQVRAADRGGRDLHDRVALVEDLRVGNGLHSKVAFSHPTIGSHDCSLCSVSWLQSEAAAGVHAGMNAGVRLYDTLAVSRICFNAEDRR